jgi:hypothetical protein
MSGLGYSAFARHYLRNHYCFLLLRVLRCFSSPRSPHVAMYSLHDDRALPLPGFPIRTPPDQSLFNGSPRNFAVYRVLHRLSLPRHPPYALISLTIKNQSKLSCHTIYRKNVSTDYVNTNLNFTTMQLSKNILSTYSIISTWQIIK